MFWNFDICECHIYEHQKTSSQVPGVEPALCSKCLYFLSYLTGAHQVLLEFRDLLSTLWSHMPPYPLNSFLLETLSWLHSGYFCGNPCSCAHMSRDSPRCFIHSQRKYFHKVAFWLVECLCFYLKPPRTVCVYALPNLLPSPQRFSSSHQEPLLEFVEKWLPLNCLNYVFIHISVWVCMLLFCIHLLSYHTYCSFCVDPASWLTSGSGLENF